MSICSMINTHVVRDYISPLYDEGVVVVFFLVDPTARHKWVCDTRPTPPYEKVYERVSKAVHAYINK